MRRIILDADGIKRHLDALAGQLRAGSFDWTQTALVGIQRRGVYLAERLATLIAPQGLPLPVGTLDISLYRDDVSRRTKLPIVRPTSLPFDCTGKEILLVDDVLFTGRTIRAALNELMDYGRPAAIRLVVLVDRGSRELPVQPDFVGLVHHAPASCRVTVHLTGIDELDEVLLEERT